MLTQAFIVGKLDEFVRDDVRNVEVESIVVRPKASAKTFMIPVRCQLGANCLFLRAPMGSKIAIRGRFEFDLALGLLIVDEADEILYVESKKK